jgi:LacI family transcriptional regulator
MKDVARTAGVSLGTVSKIINGKNVGVEYKKKVDAAIEFLGYSVNQYARGLKLSKSYSVALIIPDILNPFFASLAHYIESALYRQDYKLILCCSNGKVSKEAEYINLVQMNKVDGIIALTYGDVDEYVSTDTPLVAIDRYFSGTSAIRVSSDNYSGGIMAAEKLFEFGCVNPAFIRNYSTIPGEADKRKDGFLYACRKRGVSPVIVDLTDDYSLDDVVERLIDEYRLPNGSFNFDGVFCNTDLLAFKLKSKLFEYGVKIPDEVQIIGFDGARYFNQENEPLYVSSIIQSTQNIADKCVEMVLAQDRSTLPSLIYLPVRFEYGGTTKKPEEA